jgi:hypothetical protein
MYSKIRHITPFILSLFILSGCANILAEVIVRPIVEVVAEGVGEVINVNVIGSRFSKDNTRNYKLMLGQSRLESDLNQPSVSFHVSYYWSIRVDETFALKVSVETDESIQKEESLTFIIDDKVVTFSSFSKSNITTKNTLFSNAKTLSIGRYRISREFINKILSAEEVSVRIKLDKRDIEADFSSENPSGAKVAIKKFMKRL